MRQVTAAAAFLLVRQERDDEVIQKSELVANWGDALGVGAFTVVGANNALALGLPTSVCIVCGLCTACFGGVVRDLLCGRPPRVMHSYTDIYGTCAMLGALGFVGVARSGPGRLGAALCVGAGSAVVLRYVAWKNEVRLPIAVDGGHFHLRRRALSHMA